MMPFGRLIALASLLSFGLVVASPIASADELVWRFKSKHPRRINIELYSADGRHVWPGGNKVYAINDKEVHAYSIVCTTGEKICYGAWLRSNTDSYWGAGFEGRQSCDSCCFTCGAGDTPVLVLNR